MKTKLSKDLSTLTTVKENIFNKLENKIIWCISEAVAKSTYNREDLTEIDVGIGILGIKYDGESVRYRFIPSDSLDKAVVNSIINEDNLLVDTLETTIVSKLTNTYKNFF